MKVRVSWWFEEEEEEFGEREGGGLLCSLPRLSHTLSLLSALLSVDVVRVGESARRREKERERERAEEEGVGSARVLTYLILWASP